MEPFFKVSLLTAYFLIVGYCSLTNDQQDTPPILFVHTPDLTITLNTQNEPLNGTENKKNAASGTCIDFTSCDCFAGEAAGILCLFIVFMAFVCSLFILLYLMYKDLKLLELQPMSEWLYNPIFWKISIELVIIVAVAAMFLTNPFGLSIIGLGLIACFVFSAVAFCSHFSSDSTSNDNKQQNNLSSPMSLS